MSRNILSAPQPDSASYPIVHCAVPVSLEPLVWNYLVSNCSSGGPQQFRGQILIRSSNKYVTNMLPNSQYSISRHCDLVKLFCCCSALKIEDGVALSLQCKLCSVYCVMWSVPCAVCSVQCEVSSVQSAVFILQFSLHCVVHSVQCAFYNVYCAVRNSLCIVCCTLCIVYCAVYIGQCALCSVQCAVCSVQCAVCSVQCEVCSVASLLLTAVCGRVCGHLLLACHNWSGHTCKRGAQRPLLVSFLIPLQSDESLMVSAVT